MVFGIRPNVRPSTRLVASTDLRSESNEPEVIAQFAWIPEMMLLSLLKRDVTIELR